LRFSQNPLMASDYIQRLLEEARPGPGGVFSLDLSRVQLVFSAGGGDWLHYWLRFAHFYKADPIRIQWDGRKFDLEFESGGPDPEGLRALLLDRRRGPRYLGLGMLAAAQQGMTQIRLECPWGSLGLEGQRSHLDLERRSRDGTCRLQARSGRGLKWPGADDFAVPWLLNGKLQKPVPGVGLRLLVDGWAFIWEGQALLPPGESLDWPVSQADLDARLQTPRLTQAEIEELQKHFALQLLERCAWTPEAVEWLLLRDIQLLWRLPAPPAGHPFYPAYCERRAWLSGQPPLRGLWSEWPETMWPGVLDQGMAPFGLPEWLRATCRRLPGRVIYPYLLRRGWLGEHADPELLSALLAGRQDTLEGQVLLARQLGFLKPGQRPDRAWRFCREFLAATLAGQEAQWQWSRLDPGEQAEIRKLCEDL
jgi:hypothetical protein